MEMERKESQKKQENFPRRTAAESKRLARTNSRKYRGIVRPCVNELDSTDATLRFHTAKIIFCRPAALTHDIPWINRP